ncbi:hypothetical protein CUMW_200930 [Citrus unshiu]|uniref:P-type ATPase A domain-containing protein n=1 Tax=Citrus unshiu TaxID=55188 RepID=A0A2H5Q6X9_CITUN|nr:hypothetical protein CUMW_200930 [Citrus unshiu]
MPEDLKQQLLAPENFNLEGIDLENKFLKFLSFMWNPLSWVMETAALMAIALANGGGQGPDWQDSVGIVCLLIINSSISFIEESNTENATAALMAHLTPKTKSELTGESLTVTKETGDEVFSGLTCKHGEIEAVVIATEFTLSLEKQQI